MKPLTILVTMAMLVGLAVLGFEWSGSLGEPKTSPNGLAVAPPAKVATAVLDGRAVVAPIQDTITAKPASVVPVAEAAMNRPPIVASQRPAQPMQLDRVLAPTLDGTPHTVELDGSQVAILGTRQVTSGIHTQTAVALRDQKSGQVQYTAEGLQFTVKDASALQTLQQTYPKMTLLSATQAYVNVRIDAADLAAYYGAMKHDARVTNLTFLPLKTESHLK